MLRLDGRVVAITGAHHGLGRAHALLLAERGARLVVNDIQGAADTVAAIVDSGGEAIENTSDITSTPGTDRIVQDALGHWGRLDVIVNNAAGGASSTLPDEEGVQSTLAVHFVGTVNLIRSAMPVFREQRYGRIINTSSGSVLGIPGTGTYAAAKAAVLAYSKVLANELRQDSDLDIKVNILVPAAQTPVMPRVPDEQFQAMLDHAFAPERVSPLVVVLAHESCPVSGEAIQTGGGRVARVMLSTTAGWQAPNDEPSPEAILANWSDVMANRDLCEPVGSMADLLGRRGEPAYSVADLVQWAMTGERP